MHKDCKPVFLTQSAVVIEMLIVKNCTTHHVCNNEVCKEVDSSRWEVSGIKPVPGGDIGIVRSGMDPRVWIHSRPRQLQYTHQPGNHKFLNWELSQGGRFYSGASVRYGPV